MSILGEDVTERSDIGISNIQSWGSNIYIRTNQWVAPSIGKIFPLLYERYQLGLPVGVKFYSGQFDHPQLMPSTNNKFVLTIATNYYTVSITDGCDDSTRNSIETD